MSTSARLSQASKQKLVEAISLLDKAVLQAIMSREPVAEVLHSLCLNVEELFPGLMCSILLLDPDCSTLRHAAGPSLPRSYVQAIDGAKIGPRSGSCGTAAYRGQPVVVIDIASDPLWTEYRALALSHNLRACWSMPISSGAGNILGTFACYYEEPRTPDADHLLLIDRAVHLAGIAIEHNRIKSDLEAAETRYRTLVERLPAITYMAEVGVSGRWLFVSPQIERMLGYSPREWMANPNLWMNRIHEDDLAIALEAEKRVQETGGLYKAEYRMHARDGKTLWFRDEGMILTELDSAKPFIQGVMYDITEYKAMEEQLRQAQKMEAVGQLAGGIAHDFNNLLMVIGAHNDRIRERHSGEHPSYADSAEIHEAVLRATSLTQRLLAFSRKQVLQLQVLDLTSVIHELGTMIRRVIPENIEIRMELDPHISPVMLDRVQIEQAILNLVLNARDAMPDGGEIVFEVCKVYVDELRTFSHGSLEPGNYVMFSIRDTGSGMNAGTQSHIFEPFFTTKGRGKGTGLGLSAVYGVVRQSGGAISVESAPNLGTNFKLFFRQCEGQAQLAGGPQTSTSAIGGDETILLVEDETAIRELAGDYLLKLGYKVLAAPDGQAAIKIARTSADSIDLVLTDMVMPNMGGIELAEKIRKTNPGVKVLFMSGYPEDADCHDATSTCPGEMIRKPFSMVVLANRIRRAFD